MIDVDVSMLTDMELDEFARVHPRDSQRPLSLATEYANAIFAERQHRLEARVRAAHMWSIAG